MVANNVNQDGGVGGYMELTSLYECIKNTSTCGVILTESYLKLQKETCKTKAVRKIHTELCRKGKELNRMRLIRMGALREKREIT